MPTYRIETDKGVYEVETDASPAPAGPQDPRAQVGQWVVDAAKGVGAGVISTATNFGKLASFGLQGRFLTPAQQEYLAKAGTPPQNFAGKAGYIAEQGAELIAPFGAAAKATKALPLLGKMAAQATMGGATAAVQSGGDPTATAVGTGLGVVTPAAGAAVERYAVPVARRLYESALKPSTTYSMDQVKKLISTAFRERIPVSDKGLRKSATLVEQIGKEVQADIQSLSRNGQTIDPVLVARRVNSVVDKFKKQVNNADDLAAIESSRNEFLEQHAQKFQYTPVTIGRAAGTTNPTVLYAGPTKTVTKPIPIDSVAAQVEKQGTYARLGDKAYGEVKTASVEAQKALARGLKEELEALFPQIMKKNARQGAVMDLIGPLERAVVRINNHQLLGIGSPIMAGAGGAVAGQKGAISGLISKLILDDPTVKSTLAIRLARAGVKDPYRFIAARIAAQEAATQ